MFKPPSSHDKQIAAAYCLKQNLYMCSYVGIDVV